MRAGSKGAAVAGQHGPSSSFRPRAHELESATMKRAPLILALGVGACVFVAFHPLLGAEWINYDDPVNFQRNPHYRGLGLEQLRWMFTNFTGHYMPLTWMSLGLDYLLWGMDPAGYHFTNVLLHALNAMLCFAFLRQLLPRFRTELAPSWRNGAAAAGALLYALHPLRVESVAWITERRDLVAGLFFFLCLLAWLKAQPAGPGGPADGRWLALSAALFGLSLLGKAIGMTLPLALLVLEVHPLGRFAPGAWKRPLLEKLPFVILMLAGVAMTALGQGRAGAFHAEAHTVSQMVVRPGYRLAFYLEKTFLPVGLSVLYPDHPPESVLQPRYLISLILVLGITALLLHHRRRHPGFLAAWLAFAFLLGPVIGPIQAGPHFAADRYTYLAALPLSVLASALLCRGRPWIACGSGAILILLGILTARQCAFWRESETLWAHAIRVDRSSDIPFNQRATARMAKGDFDGALEDLDEAIRLAPGQASFRANRAAVRFRKRDLQGAQADVDKALELSPGYPMAYEVRATLRRSRGDLKGAVEDFSRAIELDRSCLEAYVERASTFGALGLLPQAHEDCATALALHPEHPGALINRGVLRGERGDLEGAMADYTEALRVAPRSPEAWGGRALCLTLRGRWREAIPDFEKALEVAPADWPHRPDTTRRLEEARRRAQPP